MLVEERSFLFTSPNFAEIHSAQYSKLGNVRLFRFSTCKLMRTYDESLDSFSTAQSAVSFPSIMKLHDFQPLFSSKKVAIGFYVVLVMASSS